MKPAKIRNGNIVAYRSFERKKIELLEDEVQKISKSSRDRAVIEITTKDGKTYKPYRGTFKKQEGKKYIFCYFGTGSISLNTVQKHLVGALKDKEDIDRLKR